MGGVCYKKNEERGAWYEKKCIRETMENTQDEKLRKFCKMLLREYDKYTDQEVQRAIDRRGE